MTKYNAPWTREGGIILDSKRNVVGVRYSWRHADFNADLVPSDIAIHPVEADENCRLMTAAPALLAALEDISCGHCHDMVGLPPSGPCGFCKDARAAIAEAKGA
jgi:hypothetical protein